MDKEHIFKIGNIFVDIVILINFVMTFLTTVTNVPFALPLEIFCVTVFVIEIIVRVSRFGISFFIFHKGEKRDHDNNIAWNYFDFIITAISVIGLVFIQSSSIASIRIIRSVRMISLLSHEKRLRSMIAAMMESIQGIVVAIIAVFIIFAIYAVIGYDMFGQQQPDAFGDGFKALLTLFELMILDGWSEVIVPMIQYSPIWGTVYFISFIFLTAFIMLNVITGVIVDSMAEVSRERRMKARKKEDHQTEILRHIKSLEKKVDELNNKLLEIKS